MKPVLPHLSVEGFIESSQILMIKIFEHFLASDYSQSTTYVGNVSSMKYILFNHKDNLELNRVLTNTLEELYGRYFPNVEVTVIIDESDLSTDKISIDVLTIDSLGVENRLSKAVTTMNNNIVNFDTLLDEMYSQY